MKRSKIRHQLFLDADLSEKLEALAARPGASKSAILADAVAAWLNRRGAQELDDRFGLRLNRISAQLNRIERDGNAGFMLSPVSAAAPMQRRPAPRQAGSWLLVRERRQARD